MQGRQAGTSLQLVVQQGFLKRLRHARVGADLMGCGNRAGRQESGILLDPCLPVFHHQSSVGRIRLPSAPLHRSQNVRFG